MYLISRGESPRINFSMLEDHFSRLRIFLRPASIAGLVIDIRSAKCTDSIQSITYQWEQLASEYYCLSQLVKIYF